MKRPIPICHLSICQVGVARYREGHLAEQWKTYVDPEDYFDPENVSIHGIDEDVIVGAPKIPEVAHRIYTLLDDRVSVCHTHFDRVAVQQAFAFYGLRLPKCVWLDSARVARRTWKEFAWRGYGLANVCAFLGHSFTHHDALEDAKAAAYILHAAMDTAGLDLEGWLTRVEQPIDPTKSSTGEAVRRAGNPEGPLYGEVLVFTGSLEVPRNVAASMAAHLGCRVDPRVTKQTTILVVGDQDIKKLAGHAKSSKHRKAQEMMTKGQGIRILREADFKEIRKCAG